MFEWTPGETGGHLLALIDQLDRYSDAEIPKGTDLLDQDRVHRAAEERQLRAADATIRAVQGWFSPNNKVILEQLAEINRILRARVRPVGAVCRRGARRPDARPR